MTEAQYSKNKLNSRFEDLIKVQRGIIAASDSRFGMMISEIYPEEVYTGSAGGVYRNCKVALLVYNLTDPESIKTL